MIFCNMFLYLLIWYFHRAREVTLGLRITGKCGHNGILDKSFGLHQVVAHPTTPNSVFLHVPVNGQAYGPPQFKYFERTSECSQLLPKDSFRASSTHHFRQDFRGFLDVYGVNKSFKRLSVKYGDKFCTHYLIHIAKKSEKK